MSRSTRVSPSEVKFSSRESARLSAPMLSPTTHAPQVRAISSAIRLGTRLLIPPRNAILKRIEHVCFDSQTSGRPFPRDFSLRRGYAMTWVRAALIALFLFVPAISADAQSRAPLFQTEQQAQQH